MSLKKVRFSESVQSPTITKKCFLCGKRRIKPDKTIMKECFDCQKTLCFNCSEKDCENFKCPTCYFIGVINEVRRITKEF